jgi:hypothetical protein
MRIGATSPEPSAPGSTEAASAPRAPAFSSVLAAQMQAPRDRIDLTRSEIRAEIEAARSAALATPSDRAYDAAGRRIDVLQQRSAVGGPDPFGWRALTRDLGDRIVGPGFGDLFERQIQQESAFEPEVVFGYRKSSAGAEGIAQLMPQYYANVDRTDPRASLIAGAQSMREYLEVFGGDVRKAMASYNAGLGTVQSLVRAHGAQWERGLPEETRSYLAAILGPARPRVDATNNDPRASGAPGTTEVRATPPDATSGLGSPALPRSESPGA